MKPLRTLFTLVLLLLTTLILVSPSNVKGADLAKHSFFKHLIGKWSTTGELKGADGNTINVTEEWTGKADADDTFYIEGTRTINNDTQPFRWSITHNAATDSFEAIHSWGNGSQELRFEATYSEVEMTFTLKVITGSGDSGIILQDSFSPDSKDTLLTKVQFTGDQGQTTLEGTLTHTREKAP